MEILDIAFKLAVCAFMIVTIIRESSNYQFLKELEKQLHNRDDDTNATESSLKG